MCFLGLEQGFNSDSSLIPELVAVGNLDFELVGGFFGDLMIG